MRDYINIGPTPAGEECAQVGDSDYHKRAFKECNRFIKQLESEFGKPPREAELNIKSFHHDFGIYHEVVCYFDTEDEESQGYCYEIEANTPEYWGE